MSLTHEAFEMVRAGNTLSAFLPSCGAADMTASITLRVVGQPGGSTLYELVEWVDGEAEARAQFTDLLFAVRHVAGRVGRASFSDAVARLRYTHFFPMGSSLEWSRSPRTNGLSLVA